MAGFDLTPILYSLRCIPDKVPFPLREGGTKSSSPPDAAEAIQPIQNHLHRFVVVGTNDDDAETAEVAANAEVCSVVMPYEVAV